MKLLTIVGSSIVTAALLGSPAQAGSHEAGHGNTHGDHKMPMNAMSHKAVAATGVVKEVLSDTNKVKIHHQPIKDWNMGAMQMTFELGPDVNIDSLKVGQTIHFMTNSPSTGKFIITQIMEL